MKGKQTINYEGHKIGDMVWIWVGWCRLLTQVKILGMTLWFYEDEPDKCHPDYTVKFVDPNGETQTYTFQEDDVFDTKKEALEAAIRQQKADVYDWRQETQKHQDTLDWLKEQLEQEVPNED